MPAKGEKEKKEEIRDAFGSVVVVVVVCFAKARSSWNEEERSKIFESWSVPG